MSALSSNAAQGVKGNPALAGAIAMATPFFDAAAWKYYHDHENDTRRLFGLFTVKLSMFKFIFEGLAGPDPTPTPP